MKRRALCVNLDVGHRRAWKGRMGESQRPRDEPLGPLRVIIGHGGRDPTSHVYIPLKGGRAVPRRSARPDCAGRRARASHARARAHRKDCCWRRRRPSCRARTRGSHRDVLCARYVHVIAGREPRRVARSRTRDRIGARSVGWTRRETALLSVCCFPFLMHAGLYVLHFECVSSSHIPMSYIRARDQTLATDLGNLRSVSDGENAIWGKTG